MLRLNTSSGTEESVELETRMIRNGGGAPPRGGSEGEDSVSSLWKHLQLQRNRRLLGPHPPLLDQTLTRLFQKHLHSTHTYTYREATHSITLTLSL